MLIERGRKTGAGQSQRLDGGVVGLLRKLSEVEPVDVLCGGFPCQDVSPVGKQAGLAPGTRSGLWSFMTEAIEALQSRWVVIANGRCLLSARARQRSTRVISAAPEATTLRR